MFVPAGGVWQPGVIPVVAFRVTSKLLQSGRASEHPQDSPVPHASVFTLWSGSSRVDFCVVFFLQSCFLSTTEKRHIVTSCVGGGGGGLKENVLPIHLPTPI